MQAIVINQLLHRLKQDHCESAAGCSDGVLLERFTRGEVAAFEAILRRHGLMVWRTCMRTLGRVHDAEDAFQAVFLVLARDAKSVRRKSSLGGWLHGVACRIARKAQRDMAIRRRHETIQASGKPAVTLDEEGAWCEMLRVLDEEIERLPRRLSDPVVLCHLEGLTQDEAARRIGCSLSTFRRRLRRAKNALRLRLGRRGCTLAAALAAPLLAECAVPSQVPLGLIRSIAHAVHFTYVNQLPPAVPAAVVSLLKGTRHMALLKFLQIALVAAVVVLLGIGAAGRLVPTAANGRATQNSGASAAPRSNDGQGRGNAALQKKRDEFTWGMSQQGLRIGIRIIHTDKAKKDGNQQRKKPAYRAGDQLQFEICFQNVGAKPFKGQWDTYHGYHHDMSPPIVRDAAGKHVGVLGPNVPNVYFSTVFNRTLQPQEKLATGPITIDIGRRIKKTSFVIPATPGRYVLTHRNVLRDRHGGRELVGMYVKGGFQEFSMPVPLLKFEILAPKKKQPAGAPKRKIGDVQKNKQLRIIEANLDRLALSLTVHTRGGKEDPNIELYNISLDVPPMPREPHAVNAKTGKPISADARISKEQAAKIVNVLAKDAEASSWISRVIKGQDKQRDQLLTRDGKCVELKLTFLAPNAQKRFNYPMPLPWGVATTKLLKSVYQCLDGKAAKITKTFLAPMPTEGQVHFEMNGTTVRYYLLPNNLIYPGTIRDGKHIIWNKAEPLQTSQYPFGGPQSRSPLIDARKITYQTEPSPNALKRIATPKAQDQIGAAGKKNDDGIKSLSFSSDGRQMASVSRGGAYRL